MTTQVLPSLDPSRPLFWAIVGPLTLALAALVAALADHLCEPRRDPAGVLAVRSLSDARRARARVARLDLESSASGAAAYRHLTEIRRWAATEHRGSGRRRAAAAALLADARTQLAALGADPDEPPPGMHVGSGSVTGRIVEPRDGALASPHRYVNGRVPEVPLLQALSRTDAQIRLRGKG